jgi:hypothetical protein
MTLAEYETLTGVTVATSQQGKTTAQLARAQSQIEVLLGYPLSTEEDVRLKNHYDEVGKTDVGCFCSSIDPETLEEPDEVVFAYRLFPYNDKDAYLHVDPFTELNAVKLVHDSITVKTFDPEDIRVDYGKDGVAFYIQLCKDCLCTPDCGNDCVQVAVDADWGYEELPTPLQYLQADMVEWQTKNKGVVSQSVLGHSYTLGEEAKTAPENKASNMKMLQGYAGYYGTVVKRPTI